MQHDSRTIRRALVSVYHKEPVTELVRCLHRHGAEIYSTGGTLAHIRALGLPARAVEELTGYPSILGGRVKTLHPAVFGGILSRREQSDDKQELLRYRIPEFDLVAVDLYPFEETLQNGAGEAEAIEQIDIGGISLIRAAAKNFRDVLVVPSSRMFQEAVQLIDAGNGRTALADRRRFAAAAFRVSSGYDRAIGGFMLGAEAGEFHRQAAPMMSLRYGENPHQQGRFYGPLQELFEQLNGKALSYNNLLDIDAALQLVRGQQQACFAVIKHTNVCGMAVRDDLLTAWKDALAGDPVSAFGGIIVTNRPVGEEVARSLHELFFEVLIAPGFEDRALEVLRQKKNRILLRLKPVDLPADTFRSALNGVLWQEADLAMAGPERWTHPTKREAGPEETADLLFANHVVKHLKSNAIALVKNRQLLGAGMGQTSRVDALRQAIGRARANGHDLRGSVMASDAFFPFPDCVEIAHQAGITAVIQPGGSVRDGESVAFCDQAGMAMAMTGLRHFKH
jgi:phosphoribosylaminoimidazolecarboxamide formyltransferase/IMP cyclohydrolase